MNIIIPTGMDFNKKENIYKDAMSSLRKFKSRPVFESQSSMNTSSIKEEPVFVAEYHDWLRGLNYRCRGSVWSNPTSFRDYKCHEKKGKINSTGNE